MVAIDKSNDTVNGIRVKVQTCCIWQHSDRLLEVLLITIETKISVKICREYCMHVWFRIWTKKNYINYKMVTVSGFYIIEAFGFGLGENRGGGCICGIGWTEDV